MAQQDDKGAVAQMKRDREWQKTRRVRIDSAIRKILADSEGRQFLWWLMEVGKVNTQPFTTNAITTAFNCGELNVGNQIQARMLEVDPASYVRMQVEILDEHREQGNGAGDAGTANEQPGAYDHPSDDD